MQTRPFINIAYWLIVGTLRALGHQPTGGKIPRHFIIASDGSFLFVGNQDSDTLMTLTIDPASGILHKAGISVFCQIAACEVCRGDCLGA